MGFFDKLKNMITGGGAKVTLEAGEPRRGGPFPVKIRAEVSDADLEIRKAYLKVAGVENVVIKDVEVARKVGEKVEVARENLERNTSTYEQLIEVAGAQTLKAKQMYEWETSVVIPGSVLPTFRGVNARHEWKLLAGLEVSGNDPDSGWVTIELG